MSYAFKEKYGNDGKWTKADMRVWCMRPGKKDENGKNIYTTEQHHKKECDVNQIIKKYDKTGLINHVVNMEIKYGDMTGIDFQENMQKMAEIKNSFMTFPPEIRKRFKNDAGEYLKFMDNPENRDEAIKLGLIKKEWSPENDGIGEHIKEGQTQANKTTKVDDES